MVSINDSIPNDYQNAIQSPQHLDWKAAIDRAHNLLDVHEHPTHVTVCSGDSAEIEC
jgi:hypothetical protein